jgi:hypothetical protein
MLTYTPPTWRKHYNLLVVNWISYSKDMDTGIIAINCGITGLLPINPFYCYVKRAIPVRSNTERAVLFDCFLPSLYWCWTKQ